MEIISKSYLLLYLLRLWSGTKNKISYSVNDLKMYLMLEEAYSEYGNFKRRVLNPAIKELNSSGYFEIQVEEVKSGRKVETINFIVKDLDKRVYFDKKENQNIIEIDKKETNKVEEQLNINTHDFYVPNKKLFTAKTLADFANDFKDYDFKDNTYKKLLQESILIALEKDDEEKIKVKSYKYFKATLENKIKNISNVSNTKQVKTRFHNINQTFNKYSPDELENRLQESQKDKFESYSKVKEDNPTTNDWEEWDNKIG